MSNNYNERLYQEESVLTVGAVQIPGLIQLNGEDWEGPIVDLLRAIARKIPWIKAIKIISETNVGDLLSTGQVAVDITPNPICIKDGVPQGIAGFSYLAIGKSTTFSGAFIYSSASVCSCATVMIHVQCVVNHSTSNNILSNLPITPVVPLYVSSELAYSAAICGGYAGTPALVTLPFGATLGDQIVAFFNIIQTGMCFAALYIDQQLSPLDVATLEANNLTYITPTSAVLAYVWTFNDYASHLQLWFQFALDQVVASGEYNAIIKAGGLDGSDRFNQYGYHQHPRSNPSGLPFRPPPAQYSIKKGFIPRAALYEIFLPKLCCYEAKCPVKVLSTEECPEEVAPPPTDNGS